MIFRIHEQAGREMESSGRKGKRERGTARASAAVPPEGGERSERKPAEGPARADAANGE